MYFFFFLQFAFTLYILRLTIKVNYGIKTLAQCKVNLHQETGVVFVFCKTKNVVKHFFPLDGPGLSLTFSLLSHADLSPSTWGRPDFSTCETSSSSELQDKRTFIRHV